MKTISIPYYTSTLDLHVDEANLKAVVTAKMHEYKAGKTEVELVHEALEHPIASPRLRDLAKGKQKVVLVTSDHTRAVPSKITLPILLDEIRQGNPDADITILIATGLHRPTTEEEQRRMFGDAIVDHEKIAINNAFDPDQFIHMGVLPSGADFNVNKLAAECDLLVTEGFIEPHFVACPGGDDLFLAVQRYIEDELDIDHLGSGQHILMDGVVLQHAGVGIRAGNGLVAVVFVDGLLGADARQDALAAAGEAGEEVWLNKALSHQQDHPAHPAG